MNYKMMGRFLAQILFIEAVLMVPALFVSLGYGEGNAASSFLISIAVAAAISGVLYLLCKGAPSAFHAREGMVCVAFSWIVLSLVGCLPFYISREIPYFVDAFFAGNPILILNGIIKTSLAKNLWFLKMGL